MPVRRGRKFRGGSWAHLNLLRRGVRNSLSAGGGESGPVTVGGGTIVSDDVPTLSDGMYTLSKTYTNGGGAGLDIAAIVAAFSTTMHSFAFLDEGRRMMVVSTGGVKNQSMTLSTGYDLSTATLTGAAYSGSIPVGVHGFYENEAGNESYYGVQTNFDDFQFRQNSTQYESENKVPDSTITKTTMGGDSTDGLIGMCPTGNYVWALQDRPTDQSTVICRALATQWDVTSGSSNDEGSIEADWATLPAMQLNGTLWMSGDGKTLLAWDSSSKIYRMDMATAWTPSAGVTVTSCTPTGVTVGHKCVWSPDLQKMWSFNRNSSGTIYEWDLVS